MLVFKISTAAIEDEQIACTSDQRFICGRATTVGCSMIKKEHNQQISQLMRSSV